MTLIYNIISGSNYKGHESRIEPLNYNIESMRDEIKQFIKKNKEKAIFANPVRHIVKIDKDASMSGGDSEPIDLLEGTNSELDQKINAELIEVMKKEIKTIFDDLNVEVLKDEDMKGNDYGFNFEEMKEHTAYILQPINVNTYSFIHFIDLIGHYFKNSCLIKCGLDDAYTERFVLYIGERLTNEPTTEELYIPINEQSFIDFMYSVYGRALFVLKSSENEYKDFTKASFKLFQNV